MNTKCVYIVTSDEEDLYLEQTYLSAYSLRHHNPDAEIVLVVDEKTERSLRGVRKEILGTVSRLCVISCPAHYSKMVTSRYLKTSLRQRIEGDYLFIDGDTIIADKLDAVDCFSFEIGAAIDKHINISDHTQKDDIISKAKRIGWDFNKWDGRYFNSGVMFVKDTKIAHELYEQWHNEWLFFSKKGINIDQPSLNKINVQMGDIITELGGEWNCQIVDNGIKFLNRAKIIHYFASSIGRGTDKDIAPYLFKNKGLYREIKEKGLTEEIKELLDQPKEAFSDKVRLIDGATSDFISSPIGRIARKLNNSFSFLNKPLKVFIK